MSTLDAIVRPFEVRVYPDPVLKMVSREVGDFEHTELEQLVALLGNAMHANGGLGIAAPQLGYLRRVIVLRDPDAQMSEEGMRSFAVVNPVIEERSEKVTVSREGCLSLPGMVARVERAEWIVMTGWSVHGEELERARFVGLPARLIQHEVDHLDGILMFDRLSLWERMNLLRSQPPRQI